MRNFLWALNLQTALIKKVESSLWVGIFYSQPKKIHPSASVWYEIGLFWAMITYLKSAWMQFLSIVQRDMAFKWASFHHHTSRGCNTVTCQSWRSNNKSDILDWRLVLLSKSDSPDFTRTGVTPLFWTFNFDRLQFCSPLAMMMYSSPKPYLYAQYWKKCFDLIWFMSTLRGYYECPLGPRPQKVIQNAHLSSFKHTQQLFSARFYNLPVVFRVTL